MLHGKLIGEGAFRYVIDLGDDTVLKLAINDEARVANLEEIALWVKAQSDKQLKGVLCPILSYDPDGQWVQMPKARTFAYVMGDTIHYDNDTLADDHPAMVQVRRTMWKHGYRDVDNRNVGVINGNRFVLIDYGMDSTMWVPLGDDAYLSERHGQISTRNVRRLAEDGTYDDDFTVTIKR